MARPASAGADTAPHESGDVTACSYLLNETTTATYQQHVTGSAERVAATIANTKRPFTGAQPAPLAERVAAVDLERPLHDTAAALAELDSVYLDDAVYFHHPRYLAHLNCPTVIPAVAGETVLSAVNSSLDTWDQSAGATMIERRLIEWTAQRLGLGPAPDGVFTSGGTQSNLHALLLARDETRERIAANTTDPPAAGTVLSRLRILTSECSHFSVTKAASLLGLDPEAVIPVPCDEHRRMRPAALAHLLRTCHDDGLAVMAVVATAGTTDFGSIDPLAEISELCARSDVWLHVDAAYGCGLLVSRHHRHLLDGIAGADSVTVDYHKSFFQPLSSSAVLVRDSSTLRHVTYHADYLNPEVDDPRQQVPNQVDKSIQTSRRFDALKLWLTLRSMGAERIGELFDSVIDLAHAVWVTIATDPRFEVVTRPQLSTLVFRYAPGGADEAELNHANEHARAEIARSGEAVVASTIVDGSTHLKFTLLNPRTTLGDVEQVLDLLASYAENHLRIHSGVSV